MATPRPSAALLALGLLACSASSSHEPSAPLGVEPEVARVAAPLPSAPPAGPVWRRAGGLRYLEIVRGASPDAERPLIVFLHGLGDRPRPTWFADYPEPARIVLPEAPMPYGQGFSWFEYRVGDEDRDQGQLGRGILAAAAQVAGAIAEIRADRPTRGEPVVTGFSQGGMLSYALALHHPDGLGAVFPLAGALPEPSWPAAPVAGRGYPPVRALHGMADPIVPYGAADAMTQALSARGFDIELQGFEGVVHTLSPEMNALLQRHLVAAMRAP